MTYFQVKCHCDPKWGPTAPLIMNCDLLKEIEEIQYWYSTECNISMIYRYLYNKPIRGKKWLFYNQSYTRTKWLRHINSITNQRFWVIKWFPGHYHCSDTIIGMLNGIWGCSISMYSHYWRGGPPHRAVTVYQIMHYVGCCPMGPLVH